MYTIIYAIKKIDHHAHLKENEYFAIKRTLREIFFVVYLHTLMQVQFSKLGNI